jgi:hypothetical protein
MIQTMIGLAAVSTALLSTANPVPRPSARADLTLTYTAEAGFAAAVKLTCYPTGGGHPKPAEACATLRRAGADPGKLAPGDSMCVLLYQPVKAELKGVWQGRSVQWTKTYGNTCEMNRATGVLFDF